MTLSKTGACPPDVRQILVDLRHDLHRHPELSFQETRTQTALREALAPLSPVSLESVAGTGLIARFAGRDSNRPCVAIRGDIDALPIQEETGAAFASVHDGVMHACGHDVHASWAVGAAYLLSADPADGDVVLLLQPGEESGQGAELLIREGVLEDVHAIFGAHVDCRLEVGRVVAQAGPLAASADMFDIVITGRGSHAARPHEGADAIVAGAAIVSAVQTIVSRRLPPGTPAVVTIGNFRSGTAANIIPETAHLTGTLRALSPEVRERLSTGVEQVARDVAAAHGVRAAVSIHPGTPPLINDAEAAEWSRDAVRSVLGDDALVPLPEVNLAGEDFACYLERIKGCFLRIGARAPGRDAVPAHSSRFLPDDEAICVGAAVLAETARRASAAITL